MLELIVLNVILILIIVGVLYLIKKKVKNDKTKDLLLLISSLLTVLSHYSSLIFHLIKDGTCIDYLKSNPNLLIPIYPCNVVMILLVVFGLLKNKNSKFGKFLVDYCFYFGIVSCLVGMFANVDFILNPTLLEFDITKSIVAHGFMLFNVLLLPAFGYVKIDLPKNIMHIFYSIIMMLFVGGYVTLLFTVLSSYETAYQVNSMFLLHSPFDGLDFLTYPVIAIIALFAYFIVFNVMEFIKYGKDNIWFKRIKKNNSTNE